MEKEIFKWAVISRFVLLLLQVLVNLLPDHQHSLDDTHLPRVRSPPHPLPVELLLGGCDNWDAEYYLAIANGGYTHEQTLAFFPFYPLLIRFFSIFLWPLGHLLPHHSVLLVCGVLINMFAFSLSAVLLYRLTLRLTCDQQLSLLASALFCLTPASVFMTVVYTESLFACLCFAGFLSLAHSHSLLASLLFSLALATRSNGVLLIAFIAYHHMMSLIKGVFSVSSLLTTVFKLSSQVMLILLPLFVFQGYAYSRYCSPGDSLTTPPWCEDLVPLSYPSIQARYWGVGLLAYYQWKQLPNFLLATPMFILTGYCLYKYFLSPGGVVSLLHQLHGKSDWAGPLVGNSALFPHMCHLLVLYVISTTTMHIQVMTRFIASSSPVVYWFTAAVLQDSIRATRRHSSSSHDDKDFTVTPSTLLSFVSPPWRKGRGHTLGTQLLVIYFSSYTVVGVVTHCNFLPWT